MRASVPTRKLNVLPFFIKWFVYFYSYQTKFSNVYFARPQDHSEECCANYYKEGDICKGIAEKVYFKKKVAIMFNLVLLLLLCFIEFWFKKKDHQC